MQLIIYFFNCCFTVGPKIFCQIIGILTESGPAHFMPIFFYESKWMNESKKNDLRKLCNIFRFNSINEGGEFESSHSNICPKKLQR